jgi:acyl-CoA thioester hydrolase
MSGQSAWPGLAGRLISDPAGVRHVLPIRVYFEDTDFSGLVYHGSYLRWCERGRSDFLRLLGNDHRALEEGIGGREPSAFVVRRMHLEFLRPARIDDVVEVETRVKEIGAAALTLSQIVKRDATVLCEAEVVVVLVSKAGKPLRLGKLLRQALQSSPSLRSSV